MSTTNLHSRSRDITGEACAWIAQLETGELTRADRDAFREWMHRSPRHVSEIRRLATLSADLAVLSAMAEPIEHAASHYEHVLSRRKQNRPRQLILVSMALALVAVGVVSRGLLFDLNVELQQESFVTGIGEQRKIVLIDGTEVLLNTDSQLQVDYTHETRRVELVSGEAFFDVTPDTERAFLVFANDRSVRAVGTAFAVRALDKNLTVTVVEGRVEVTQVVQLKPSPRPNISQVELPTLTDSSLQLTAGQSATLDPTVTATHVVEQTRREQQRALSWQEGIHDFAATPLKNVIQEINRYSNLEIEIADPALGELEFGGIFRIGDTQPLLDALEASYGVTIQRLGDAKVRLSLESDTN